jgi:DNA-binding NtrC family response regulator
MLDLRMPEVDGVSALREAKKIDPSLIIIILTGFPSSETIDETMIYGASDYLVKPFDADRLFAIVGHWLSKKTKPLDQ